MKLYLFDTDHFDLLDIWIPTRSSKFFWIEINGYIIYDNMTAYGAGIPI